MRFGQMAVLMLLLCSACSGPPDDNLVPLPVPPTVGAEVTGVQLGDDNRSFILDVSATGGQVPCNRPPRIVEQREDIVGIWIKLAYDTDTASPDCSSIVRSVFTFTTSQSVGERDLNIGERRWYYYLGRYRQCGSGCPSRKTPCSTFHEETVRQALKLAPDRYPEMEHCDETWLVVYADTDGKACTTDPLRRCSATLLDRYFLHWSPIGWEPFLRAKGQDCEGVLKVQPSFPRAVCERPITPTPW